MLAAELAAAKLVAEQAVTEQLVAEQAAAKLETDQKAQTATAFSCTR